MIFTFNFCNCTITLGDITTHKSTILYGLPTHDVQLIPSFDYKMDNDISFVFVIKPNRVQKAERREKRVTQGQ